jgi:hypothetical protein
VGVPPLRPAVAFGAGPERRLRRRQATEDPMRLRGRAAKALAVVGWVVFVFVVTWAALRAPLP